MSPHLEYVDPEYVEDGYIQTDYPVIFYSGSTRLSLFGPAARSGTVRMLQPEEFSTGWARQVYAPICAIHTMRFDYTWMYAEDRDALMAFFEVVDGTAKAFTYTDGATGDDVSSRFLDPSMGYEEDKIQTSRLSFGIWSSSSFFPAAAVPGIGDADTVLTRLYLPFTYRRERKQPMVRLSDGSVAVYNKSSIKRDSRSLSLPYRTRAELAALIAFYTTSAQGGRYSFSWTLDGAAKTCRFGADGLSWSQQALPDELYDVTLSLEEDA